MRQFINNYIQGKELDNAVDRVEFLSKWKELVHWKANQTSAILVFSGTGGIGKSTLCKMARDQYLIPYEIPFAYINFDTENEIHSPPNVFWSIRTQLSKFKIKFPTFDIVWAKYHEEVTGQEINKSFVPTKYGDAADIVGSFLPLNPKNLANVGKQIWSHLSPRERKLKEQLRDMSSKQLEHFLAATLAQDIDEAMNSEKYRGNEQNCRITIIFDAFERLEEFTDKYKRNECDWFVKEFCHSCKSALNVICGREGVKWDDDNQDLYKRLIELKLNNLPHKYADEYLYNQGINNPELRNKLFTITDGFPYHLELAADVCNIIKKRGLTATEKDFLDAENAKDLSEFLLSRLLRQLEKDEQDAAPLAAIPGWFTREFLAEILPLKGKELILDRLFNQLISFSFCEPVSGIPDAYAFRKEVRSYLLEKLGDERNNEKWERNLFEAYLSAADKLSIRLRESVLYYEELAIDVATKLDDSLLKARAYLHMALTLNRLQHFREAVEMTSQAFTAAEQSGDKEILARCLIMRAGIETEDNPDYGNLPLLDQAANLFKKIHDSHGQIDALQTKVCIALHTRQYTSIEKPLNAAEKISENLKDTYLSAILLQLRGEYHAHIGQWEKAGDYLQRAKQKFEQVKAEIPRRCGICAATGWLGVAQYHLGDKDKGIHLIHEALSTERDVLRSPEGVAKWLQCVGEMFSEEEVYAEALSILWLCRIMRKELRHKELSITEETISEVRRKIGKELYTQIKKDFKPQDSVFYEYTYLRGLGPFRKYENNPILVPQGNEWESLTVYNPATWTDGKKVYMLYRAEGPSEFEGKEFSSQIGLAISGDGINFKREPKPVLSPTEPYEKPGGCEDPRITRIKDLFYMTYTAYDGKVARLAMATSLDLRSWDKKRLLFTDNQWDAYFPRDKYPDNPRGWSKSGAILPQKVKGRYWMYFGDTCIWAAWTEDPELRSWEIIPEPVLRPRPDHFDSKLVEPGPSIQILPEGIWLGYNGADDNLRYGFGQALFSLNDPTELIHRCTYPLLEPSTKDEIEGQIPQVVFAEGLVFFKEQWLLYYGMADSRIGVAFAGAKSFH